MPIIDDTEYLFLTTRVRSLENNMLTHDRMEAMLESGNAEDAVKVLQECGYADITAASLLSLEQSLAAERQKTFEEIAFFLPDPTILDVFRVKFDYHNVKVLLKSLMQGVDGSNLLTEAGRVPLRTIQKAVLQSELIGIPARLQDAILEAREVLSATKDPQIADAVLDRYYYDEMFELAARVGSAFLEGYVRVSIDTANLRSIIRTARIGKGVEFLRTMLFSGGNIDVNRIVETVASGASLEDFYSTTVLREAAAAGVAALQDGGLTRFEKLCDDAVSRYLSTARYVPFGEQPVISYLAAKETEYTTVRIIMTGLIAGLKPDTIRERLREVYV